MTLYSFKDVVGAFSHPAAGLYTLAGGNVGLGQFSIQNATDRTMHDIAADGSVMVSYIPGDNGTISIEAQQTSDLHAFLVNWFNIVKTAADNGDIGPWAAANVTIRSLLDGTTHTAFGVSPSKIPDKVYAKQGGNVTWSLMAARIITF